MLLALAAWGESEKPQVTEESNLAEDSISVREQWPFSELDAEKIEKVNINIIWCRGQKPSTRIPTDCSVLCTPTILPDIGKCKCKVDKETDCEVGWYKKGRNLSKNFSGRIGRFINAM